MSPILFRANKKRKTGLRQRAASPETTTIASSSSSSAAPDTTSSDPSVNAVPNDSPSEPISAVDDGGTEAHIRSATRHRLRKRLNGVGFSAHGYSTVDTDPSSSTSSSRALVAIGASPSDDDPLIAKRFAPQTGTPAANIVNKHMMEYIESHLSNRKPSAAQPVTSPSSLASTSSQSSASRSPSSQRPQGPTDADPKIHSIMRGRIMEVDLGDEVRARNKALTERATRRLHGKADVVDADNSNGRKAKKARPEKDGKSWRQRNQRNDDDIKRDQLVEEVLHENRLDVYDVPESHHPHHETDFGADDRVAEQFRREFMEAMIQRRRQKRKSSSAPPRTGPRAAARTGGTRTAARSGARTGAARTGARKAEEGILRGPKLGGSRNVRAAMRDILLKKEKEKLRR